MQQGINEKIQQARAAGYTDQQIRDFLNQRQTYSNSNRQVLSGQEAGPSRSGAANWLPMAGAIGGGLLAAPFTGGTSLLGTAALLAAGGAIGGGLGEFGAQRISGEDLDLGRVGREVGVSGAFGAAGPFAGKAIRGARDVARGARATRAAGALDIPTDVMRAAQPVTQTTRPNLLQRTGERALSSQAVIGKPEARALNLPETASFMSRLGFDNINRWREVSQSVTGAQGVLPQIRRRALSKGMGVETTGIEDAIRAAGADELVVSQPHVLRNFENTTRNVLRKLYGGSRGTISPTANAIDVDDAVRTLKNRAFKLTEGKGATAIGPETRELQRAYLRVADALDERLTQAVGNVRISDIIRNDDVARLAQVAPGNRRWRDFINQVRSAETVGELSSLQRPFVNAARLATENELMTQTAGRQFARSGRGLLTQALTGPTASRVAGGTLRRTGDAAASIPGSPLARTAAPQVGGRLFTGQGPFDAESIDQGMFTSTDSSGFMDDPTLTGGFDQPDTLMGALETMQPQSPYPIENAIHDIQRDPQNQQYYMNLFDFIQERSSMGDELSASQRGELSTLSSIEGATQTLLGMLKDAGGGQGVLRGGITQLLAQKTNTNPAARAFEDYRRGLIGQFAKAISGESGRLTDQDIARAEGIIPRLTDTPETIEYKLRAMQEILASRRQAVTRFPGAGTIGPMVTEESVGLFDE